MRTWLSSCLFQWKNTVRRIVLIFATVPLKNRMVPRQRGQASKVARANALWVYFVASCRRLDYRTYSDGKECRTYSTYLRLVQQDARVELHKKQAGIESAVPPVVRENVVPSLRQSVGQGLEGIGWWRCLDWD